MQTKGWTLCFLPQVWRSLAVGLGLLFRLSRGGLKMALTRVITCLALSPDLLFEPRAVSEYCCVQDTLPTFLSDLIRYPSN
jgi:hypothetical protein